MNCSLENVIMFLVIGSLFIQSLFVCGWTNEAYFMLIVFGCSILVMVVIFIIFMVSMYFQSDQYLYSYQSVNLKQPNQEKSKPKLPFKQSLRTSYSSTSLVENQQPLFINGHNLISSFQYQQLTKLQTKKAVSSLLQSRQYSKFILSRTLRQSRKNYYCPFQTTTHFLDFQSDLNNLELQIFNQ